MSSTFQSFHFYFSSFIFVFIGLLFFYFFPIFTFHLNVLSISIFRFSLILIFFILLITCFEYYPINVLYVPAFFLLRIVFKLSNFSSYSLSILVSEISIMLFLFLIFYICTNHFDFSTSSHFFVVIRRFYQFLFSSFVNFQFLWFILY